ncbi:hypothetical protein MHH81_17360 [Psychrobacillus sp. FSL H8-0484]|uniref:hypothetical protein n=1 Tax=Psychrobacillus sp. FSL H8-0484 TaxID=2921390 RepID=UPI0030F54E9E
MKHICIIGGSGMLAGVTKWYADNDYIVSVVARNEEKMNRMKNACSNPENIRGIYVDYRDSTKLEESLQQNINRYGPFSEAVVWVHSDGLNALITVFELLEEKTAVWHIIGSKGNAQNLQKQYYSTKDIQYNLIQLGFLRVNNSQRWLTNKEIADGVIYSIRSGDSYNLIGEIS